MEPITIKFEPEFLKLLEGIMKHHHYATISEFIREAVREKVKILEKEEISKRVEKIAGFSKRKTTDEQLHAIRDKAFEQLEKKFKSREAH